MSFALTRQQRRLLDFIIAFKAERGVAPSLREMAGHLALKSPSNIHALLNQLEDRRLIFRLSNRARAIEVLEQSASPHAAAVEALGRVGAPSTDANVARVASALKACLVERSP